jgi:hypothetical protein
MESWLSRGTVLLIVVTTTKGELSKAVDVFYVRRHPILSDFNIVSTTRYLPHPLFRLLPLPSSHHLYPALMSLP